MCYFWRTQVCRTVPTLPFLLRNDRNHEEVNRWWQRMDNNVNNFKPEWPKFATDLSDCVLYVGYWNMFNFVHSCRYTSLPLSIFIPSKLCKKDSSRWGLPCSSTPLINRMEWNECGQLSWRVLTIRRHLWRQHAGWLDSHSIFITVQNANYFWTSWRN